MIFSWLRSQVKSAVLAGVSDAVAELQADDGGAIAQAALALPQRLQQLPAPPPAEPEGNGRRKRAAAE